MRLRCTRMVNRAWAYNERKLNVSADVVTADAGAGGVSISTVLDANLLDLAGTELDLPVQAANTVFAGPVAGAAAAPSFRAPVEADLPAHDIITKHSYTGGGAFQVVGLSAVSTLAMLTPTWDPGPASALLRTGAGGQLIIETMGIGMGVVDGLASAKNIRVYSPAQYYYEGTGASSLGALFRAAGDTYPSRFAVSADGNLFWGDGTNAHDIRLYRSAAHVLQLTDSLVVDVGITDSGLTATRVVFAGAGGLLSDDANLTFTVATGLLAVGGPITALGLVSVSIEDAVTNAITEICRLRHNSTGTPAAGFGASLGFYLESSTTENQAAGRIRYYWQVASHANRAAYGVISAYGQTAERDCILFGASVLGGGSMVGFHGIGPIVRPSAYTQTYSTASRTHASPMAASVSVTATQTNPWGYSAKSEADAIVTAINNLIFDVANVKQVLNQALDDLQAYGLLA